MELWRDVEFDLLEQVFGGAKAANYEDVLDTDVRHVMLIGIFRA